MSVSALTVPRQQEQNRHSGLGSVTSVSAEPACARRRAARSGGQPSRTSFEAAAAAAGTGAGAGPGPPDHSGGWGAVRETCVLGKSKTAFPHFVTCRIVPRHLFPGSFSLGSSS